jgi:hypothetical protein
MPTLGLRGAIDPSWHKLTKCPEKSLETLNVSVEDVLVLLKELSEHTNDTLDHCLTVVWVHVFQDLTGFETDLVHRSVAVA